MANIYYTFGISYLWAKLLAEILIIVCIVILAPIVSSLIFPFMSLCGFLSWGLQMVEHKLQRLKFQLGQTVKIDDEYGQIFGIIHNLIESDTYEIRTKNGFRYTDSPTFLSDLNKVKLL